MCTRSLLIRAAVSPAALLFLALDTPAQSPPLAPAKFLPGSPVVGPAAGTQKAASMAAGSGSSLLVFEDTRAGDSDLFGVRLDAAGAPLDPLPFPITKDPGNQTMPRVAWNGSNWLVTYSNQVDPGTGYFASEFASLRVSPAGQVLDPAPIVLAMDSTGGNFVVASDGQNWAVLYTGYSAGNNGIRARRIGPDGSLLDPAGVVVFPGTYYLTSDLKASYAQGEYLFAWSDNGLQARRYDSQLQPLDPAPVLLLPGTGEVAASDDEFLVAWTRQTPLFTSEVVGTRFDANLDPIGANPFPISGSAPNVNHTTPRLVWDGSQWVVSWLTSGTLAAKAARITAAGIVLDPGGVPVPDANPNYFYDTALGALPSGGATVLWDDVRNNWTYDLFGLSLDPGGTFGTERCYSLGSESLKYPRVTAGNGQYLVTYRAELSTGSRILAQRVDTSGQALDAEPLEVASATHLSLFAGGAAWNGSVFLVTWSDATQVRVLARRMLPNGTWLDATPIVVLTGSSADTAALGNDFLVTGLHAPFNPQYVFSYGARVRGSDGAVLDSPALGIGPSFATRARVTTLGGRWLVATESHWTHDENQSNLMFNFVDAAGMVTASANAGLLNIQNWGIIDVVSSGSSALIVGQTGSNWTNTDVYVRRILPDGSMPASLLNVTGSVGLGQHRPALAWTGSEYLVAYETYQNNVWFYDYEPDVYAVRVSEGGALIDPAGFALFSGEDYEILPDASGLGGGQHQVAVASYVDGNYASYRIALRGPGVTCQTDLGYGGPGTMTLSVCGGDLTQAGAEATLTLTGATPSSTVFLPVGLMAAPTPFRGGTLVPVPWARLVPLATNAAGDLSLTVPGSGGPPVPVYIQVIDPVGGNYDFSNALELLLGT